MGQIIWHRVGDAGPSLQMTDLLAHADARREAELLLRRGRDRMSGPAAERPGHGCGRLDQRARLIADDDLAGAVGQAGGGVRRNTWVAGGSGRRRTACAHGDGKCRQRAESEYR